MEKSWKMDKKIIVMENILKRSWNFSTAHHESRTRSSDNSISIGLLQSSQIRIPMRIISEEDRAMCIILVVQKIKVNRSNRF